MIFICILYQVCRSHESYKEGRVDRLEICKNERSDPYLVVALRIAHEIIMNNWDEIRTAFQVARMGTVSGAAEILGVHHATVIRHIDALEETLSVKLFQRHPRGYTATEAGADLLRVAHTVDEQFSQLANRIKGQGECVSGDLAVTSLASFSPLILPVLAGFQKDYPEVNIRYLTGQRLFRLEYGEAHVAIRAGPAPEEPDNVVQHLLTQSMALVGSKGYFARFGQLQDIDDLRTHHFVGPDSADARAPFYKWLFAHVEQSQMTFRVSEQLPVLDAVIAGAGLGFVPQNILQQHAELVEAIPSQADWDINLWIVTHVDLHRTAKVQAFLRYLKMALADGNDAT
jgi:DNA-binding transcriptional LysR family regulator